MNRNELVDKVARQLEGSQFEVIHDGASSRIRVSPSPGAQFYIDIRVGTELRAETCFILVAANPPGSKGSCLLRARYRGKEGEHGPTSLFTFLMHTALVISCKTRIVERPLLGAGLEFVTRPRKG